MQSKIIIIGSGIAAISAIKSIRESDATSEITVYGKEAFLPYFRIKLSKNILEKIDPDKILVQQAVWYEKNRVKLVLSTEITGINPEKKEVSLSTGGKDNYTKLLIASGAKNFIPNVRGMEDIEIYSIRDIEDTWNVFDNLTNKQDALIIGGGVLGLEAAWIFSQNGKKVTISERSSGLMVRQLDEESSKMLIEIIENNNVNILLNSAVDSFKKSEKIICHFKDGDIKEFDMIFFSTGITPNIDFLKNSDIQTNRGVIVDKTMKTNLEDIYAAGDVAEMENSIAGLWSIAMVQGKIAGQNISMPDSPSYYENVIPSLSMNAFNISLFSMGRIEKTNNSNSVKEINFEEKKYTRLFFENDYLVGAIVIGDNKNSLIFKSLIEKKIPLINIDLSKSIEELILYMKDAIASI